MRRACLFRLLGIEAPARQLRRDGPSRGHGQRPRRGGAPAPGCRRPWGGPCPGAAHRGDGRLVMTVRAADGGGDVVLSRGLLE